MNRLKSSRAAGFVTVGVVYVVAAAGGVLLDRALPFAFWLNLLIADVAATVFTFVFSLVFANASVYDPYWSVQPLVILTASAVTNGMNAHRLLLLVAVWIWGVRLTANWAYTFHGLSHQDWRYTMLREKTGKFYPFVNFAGIHMFPTLVVYLCTLPAVYAFHTESAPGAAGIAFFVLSVAAVALQTVADVEMQRFRRDVHHGFIRSGVWKYARHPNYLGEILMWWGVGLSVVCAMPDRWYLLAGALLNTVMFLVISIPMADRRQSAKEGYAAYRAATRSLLPIKKKAKE